MFLEKNKEMFSQYSVYLLKNFLKYSKLIKRIKIKKGNVSRGREGWGGYIGLVLFLRRSYYNNIICIKLQEYVWS